MTGTLIVFSNLMDSCFSSHHLLTIFRATCVHTVIITAILQQITIAKSSAYPREWKPSLARVSYRVFTKTEHMSGDKTHPGGYPPFVLTSMVCISSEDIMTVPSENFVPVGRKMTHCCMVLIILINKTAYLKEVGGGY